MFITIMNYAGKRASVRVPEGTTALAVKIIAGDEVVEFEDWETGESFGVVDAAEVFNDARKVEVIPDAFYVVMLADIPTWEEFSEETDDACVRYGMFRIYRNPMSAWEMKAIHDGSIFK